MGAIAEDLKHTWEVLDLNTREQALLIWFAVGFSAALTVPGVRRAFGGLVGAFFATKLVQLYVALVAYVTAVILGLAWLGVWGWDNLKTTLIWGATFAFVTMMRGQRLIEPGAVRRLRREIFNGAVVVVFIAQVVTLPLWGEVILVPVLILVALLLAVAETQPENAIIVPPLRFLQSSGGMLIIGYSAVNILGQWRHYATSHQLREFVLPILLSALFLPFAYAVSVWMTYESAFLKLSFVGLPKSLIRAASRRAIWSFRGDVELARRFVRDVRLQDVTDLAGTMSLIRREKALRHRERHPPPLDPSQGWSPYAAMGFLKAAGLSAGDYHPAFNHWEAASAAPRVRMGLASYRLSYAVSGTEHAATRLSLTLDVDEPAPEGAGAAFTSAAKQLLGHLTQAGETPPDIAKLDGRRTAHFQSGARLRLGRRLWGDRRYGGYARELSIRHPADREPWDL
jgi:hypothetical protein